MHILFANPPWWEAGPGGTLRKGIRAGSRWPFTLPAAHAPDQFRFGGYLPFPFFLAHAAAHTQQLLPEATVEIRDSIARGESYNAFFEHLQTRRPDWLVLETATAAWVHDSTLLQILQSAHPEIRVILAGPLDAEKHAGIFSFHPNVKAIVCGEYDKLIAAAITAPSPAQVFPHNLLTREELAASPLPMWDEAAALHYYDACPPMPESAGPRAPQLTLWTSRGCPHKCIFCVWPAVMTGNDPDGSHARTVRFYLPDYIERHILNRLAAAHAAGHPYRTLYLDDDTFNLSKKHTRDMCAVLAKIGLPWSAMCRADTIGPDEWRLMRDSGCYGVKLGFESGSQAVIDTIINKKLDLAAAKDTAIWLRKELGLTVHGTFTINLPGETKEQQAETLAYIDALYRDGGLDSHQLSGTAEIEGTPMHTLAREKTLAAYPAAEITADYLPSPDGQAKIEQLQRQLR